MPESSLATRLCAFVDRVLTAFEQPFIRAYVGATVQDTTITTKESFDFWHSKGLPFVSNWGCLGNEQRETGFNWTAVGDHGNAHGIAQWWWEPRGREILEGCGIDVRTAGHKGQLAAMYWELEKTGLLAKLMACTTVQAACDILVRKYERPAEPDRDVTLQVGFANALKAKHPDWELQQMPPLVVTAPAGPVPAKAAVPVPPPSPSAAAPIAAKVVPLPAPAISRGHGAFPSHLARAGSFPVVQDPCPHLSAAILASAPRAGVVHTTEGSWAAAMAVFRVHWAPHFLVGLNTKGQPQISQLAPIGFIGASLEHLNNLAIVQVEVVARSKETVWLPDAGTLAALQALMAACEENYGIPLSHPWADGDFGRYGDNPHREAGKFGKVPGWFGHGDIAQNHHWDPGALAWSKVFDGAKALAAPALVA